LIFGYGFYNNSIIDLKSKWLDVNFGVVFSCKFIFGLLEAKTTSWAMFQKKSHQQSYNFSSSIFPSSHLRNSMYEFSPHRSDGTSGKTFASGTRGMGFKFRANQISHTLPTTRHRYNLWSAGSGANPLRWASLTHDTRKGIKRV